MLVVAAGDIACPPGAQTSRRHCGQAATARLVRDLHPDALLPLGDEQYNSGQLADFRKSYAPTWGRLFTVTHPTPGNHEYTASKNASGYRAYFGKRATPAGTTYYSFDLGSWHLIALDSNCAQVAGGCSTGSPQQKWLARDLRAHPAACTLAYYHEPRFSSGIYHGSSTEISDLHATLESAHVDLVLNGHEHNYERFAPQDHTGMATAYGIREFVVGTGGNNLYPFGAPIANSEVHSNASFGVLALHLTSGSYTWQFHPTAADGSHDHGHAGCQ